VSSKLYRLTQPPSGMLRDVQPISGKVRRSHGGGTLRGRVFKHFSWLEVGSVRAALSRPTHATRRVTHTVGHSFLSTNCTLIMSIFVSKFLILLMEILR